MNVLAIDTATLTAAVAVARDGRVVAARDAHATTHSEQLLPLIDDLLKEAGLVVGDLHAVACGAGPGSFTGLRIGLATAKGIAYAVRCPLHLASSLEILAAAAEDQARAAGLPVLAVLDARKKEVYVGLYEAGPGGDLALVGDEVVCAPSRIGEFARGRSVLVVGDGAVVYPAEAAAAGQVLSMRPTPDAAVLARLTLAGRTREAPLHSASPSYVRKSEAELKWDQKKAPKV